MFSNSNKKNKKTASYNDQQNGVGSNFVIDLSIGRNKQDSQQEEEVSKEFDLSEKLKKIFPSFSKIKLVYLFIWPIVKGISKLVYALGWLIMFVIRFSLFILEKIFSIIFSIITFSWLRKSKKKKKKKFRIFNKKKPKDSLIANSLKEGTKINWSNLHLRKKKEDKNKKEEGMNLWRSVLGFSLAVFLLILPFKVLSYYEIFNFKELKGDILSNSKSGVENFLSASELASQFKSEEASQKFAQASDSFFQAEQEMEKVDNFILKLTSLSKNPKTKLASESKNVIQAGVNASNLGNELTLALEGISNSEDIKTSLTTFLTHSEKALASSQKLEKNLKNINPENLPYEYRQKFIELRKKTTGITPVLKETIALAKGLKPFLGLEKDKRYLLVFQNNNELRASGGFMGSYALVDFRNGKIKNLEVPKGGTYDTEAGMDELVESPDPLKLVSNRWYFWDSNWWPDWKKSAENIMWFYEHSDGPTVDGVISFTPTVMERLLKIIGPIEMEEYNLVLNEDNFWQEVQSIVEEKTVEVKATSTQEVITQQNTEPKKIIGDMMNKILEEVPQRLNKENMIDIVKSVEESLAQKHILLYFNEKDLQEKVEERGWAGRIKHGSQDYLMVVNSNIAGQKTDRKIKQFIYHQSHVNQKGSITNTVKIIRQHQGIKNEEFTGVRNVNWLRVYVPLGSKLISAQGFEHPDEKYFSPSEVDLKPRDLVKNTEGLAKTDPKSETKIYRESNKTVFANWTMVDPGQTDVIIFKYRLPFKLDLTKKQGDWKDEVGYIFSPENENNLTPYSLLVQKQPGSLNTEFESKVTFDKPVKSNWYYPKDIKFGKKNWNLQKSLDTDIFITSLLEKEIK